MSFTVFLRIVRAHGHLIVMTVLIVVAAAAAISLLMSRKYSAEGSVVIDFKGGSPMATNAVPVQVYPGYLVTQMDIIASQSVALKVVDDLKLETDSAARSRYLPAPFVFSEGLARAFRQIGALARQLIPQSVAEQLGLGESGTPEDAALQRYRLAEQLLKRLALKPSTDSSVVKLSYTAGDPQAAADAANAFVRAYIATNLELNVNPARHSSEWFGEQLKGLADNLAKARGKYSAYQQETGIVAADENLDVENARLNELSNQLVGAQAQNHPAIQALKDDLARAEAKLNDLPSQLGPNHPQVRRAQAEVASLRAKVAGETRRIAGSIQGQVAAQKGRVLQMKKQRAELAILKGEVDNAQRALDEAMQRSTQLRMESHVNQTNVSVVRSAVPPIRPSAPNLPLNVGAAAVLGGVLSIGLALWRELTRRLVRSRDDLKVLLGIPVLGVLHGPESGQAVRYRFERAAAPRLIADR